MKYVNDFSDAIYYHLLDQAVRYAVPLEKGPDDQPGVFFPLRLPDRELILSNAGNHALRQELADQYVDAIWPAYPDHPVHGLYVSEDRTPNIRSVLAEARKQLAAREEAVEVLSAGGVLKAGSYPKILAERNSKFINDICWGPSAFGKSAPANAQATTNRSLD